MRNEIKIQANLLETLSKFYANKINSYLHKKGLELQKMRLGIEILLINISNYNIYYSNKI